MFAFNLLRKIHSFFNINIQFDSSTKCKENHHRSDSVGRELDRSHGPPPIPVLFRPRPTAMRKKTRNIFIKRRKCKNINFTIIK
jgi:hypothetical protein